MLTRFFREVYHFLLGDKHAFSLHVRTFHFTSLSAFILVLIGVIQNALLGFWILSLSMLAVGFALICVFALSRFYGKKKFPVIMFLITTYLIITSNYFFNSGINGPSLMVFFVALVFMLTISKNKWHILLVFLHLALPGALLWIEFKHSEWVPSMYRNTGERYLDIGFTYAICLIFMIFVARFVRNIMNEQRLAAINQSKLISAQNNQIQESNESLALLNERFKMLFSIISHDLRSPLSSIESYLLVLKSNPDLPKEDRKMLESELLKLTKGSTALLDNLLQWSRTQVTKVQSDLLAFLVVPVIKSACNLLDPIASEKFIKIQIDAPDGLMALGNEHQTEVVLRNLIQNAIKFSPLHSEVIVKVESTNDLIEFTIIDKGIGISEAKASDLFVSLVSPSYGTSNEKGAGLGLLLSSEFIALQKGRIWIEETGENGTRIKFVLHAASHIE